MEDKGFVLVTGGAGYVGSHTNHALVAAGYRTVVLDNLVYGHEENVPPGSELVKGELADSALLEGVFARFPIRAVMHFASYTYVGESVQDPAHYYEDNLIGALSLLGAMRKHDVKPIIFSSSAAVYGMPKEVPIVESSLRAPINPYGRTKYIIEMMLEDYARAYGIRFVALRYFNAAGADPSGTIGEDHDPETHLIPNALHVLVGKRDKLSIFGTDYGTPDGTCVRDYIHVSDLASAHLLALDHLQKGGDSDIFNVGLGRGFSVKEVADAVERATGRALKVEMGPRRAGDPDVLVADSSKLQNKLGWKPLRTDIVTIVSDAWRYHARRFG